MLVAPASDKINAESVIKCDNKYRFILFNCNYVGKPTTKWVKRWWVPQTFIDFLIFLFIPREFPVNYDPRGTHYYCPRCGKEIFNRNLVIGTPKDVDSLSNIFRLIFILFIIAFLIFLILSINDRRWIFYAALAMGLSLFDLLAILFTKK